MPVPLLNVPSRSGQWAQSDCRKKPSFYLSLAIVALKCFYQGLVQHQQKSLQEFLKKEFKPVHVSLLSWLFANTSMVPSVLERSAHIHNADGFVALVAEVMHEAVITGLIQKDDHGALLRDLGLYHGCWPLNILSPTLCLLARIFIYRLQMLCSDTEDDPLILNIWKGLVSFMLYVFTFFSSFISTLEENALNENEAEEGLFHTWALC